MSAPFRRLTGSFSLSGAGLHSGRDCALRISPYEGELTLTANGQESPISALRLEGTGRGSDYVFPDGSRVRTCEHVLAALTGMGVWEARLEVEGGEMPALDGCAARVSEAVLENSAPCTEGPAPLTLSSAVVVGGGPRFAAALPAPEFHLTCVVSYGTPLIGTQMLDFDGGPEAFHDELARARTFAMASEIEALRSRGMALGGSLDNAILVGEDGFQAAGGLRWPDEFVRHKALDLIGDLAALGRPLRAQVLAVRGGHELHLRLVERLRALLCRGQRP